MIDNPFDLFRELTSKLGLGTPSPDADFERWYAALVKGAPRLAMGLITLDPANFRKALRQAYQAGRDAADI